MAKSKNKQTSGLFAQAFGVAKKLSSELQKLQVAPTTSGAELVNASQIVEGKARFKSPFEVESYESPQHMLRQQLPKLSHQLLGRHYGRVNNVATFVSPDLGEKVSDYLFQWLNEFSSNSSLTEKILEEAGVKDIAELTRDTGRSQRLSQALIEQNKLLAAAQGLITGATGVWGAAVDIPASIVLALRTIYQTGRSHGFDLSEDADQEIVAFVFKEIDLGIVAEKQTLLLALKALKSMLETHDLQQFQQLLGSNNDIELIKKWLVDEEGQFKWGWLNHIPQVSVIGRLTPVAGAALGGFYSWKLLEDVGHKSQSIFGAARFYLNEHPEENISPLEAYLKAEALLKKASPRLLNAENVNNALQSNAQNEVITQVEVQVKNQSTSEESKLDEVELGIEQLAEKHVVEHEHTEQQSALKGAEEQEALTEKAELVTEQKTIDIEPASNKHS
ncbi:EcsC family protein [Acinetobacter venetianus]|uniref:EcsC family protein n=1 Tax=Acinetobacter venetianus TaxID=52133 RepID=UPI0010A5D601|nr:EcsC family protein [Acinetobacter venetianus]MCR4532445.1 EcsC family protein [Acinetobacter venetianus]MDA0697740.1 EcsC family protein [Pseudomonadota bacterium]MDA1255555.1 EcsC family protein [Pseudomonadota bacterium]